MDPHLADGGIRLDARDPRCHQQVVYAIAMSVLERFERYLGREFRWWGDSILTLVPHAFEGANAYFDPAHNTVVFGYFEADDHPGANLPGQTVFTCLSADIVAHEVTHAVVHRLRWHYQNATNRDVFAFHEAIADLMALFQHFLYRDIVAEAIKSEKGSLSIDSFMFELASEFGYSLGRGVALRSAVEEEPNPDAFRNATEPHERGAYFVAAVFDAFRAYFDETTKDLIRIATNGTGELSPGHLTPDLTSRLTSQALTAADRFLAMVVGAFNYLPPCDVTFGDVVRAIITADWTLNPDDESGVRRTMVEALRRRGIVPEKVSSLSEEALLWPAPVGDTRLVESRDDWTKFPTIAYDLIRSLSADESKSEARDTTKIDPNTTTILKDWAHRNASLIGLDPDDDIMIHRFNTSMRRSDENLVRPEIIIQFTQLRDLRKYFTAQRGETDPKTFAKPLRRARNWIAGATVVADIEGRIRHVIVKPLPLPTEKRADDLANTHYVHGEQRLGRMLAWIATVEEETDDPLTPWDPEPAVDRLNFASLHAGIEEHAADILRKRASEPFDAARPTDGRQHRGDRR